MERITCEHRNIDNTLCNASPRRGERFCNSHYKYYGPDDQPAPPKYEVPLFNSIEAIQRGTQQVMQALMDRIITQKEANSFLLAAQINASLLKHPLALTPEQEERLELRQQREAARIRREKTEDFKAMHRAKREMAKEARAESKAENSNTNIKKAADEKSEEAPEEMSFLEKLLTDKYNQMMAEPNKPKATTSHMGADATTSHVGAGALARPAARSAG